MKANGKSPSLDEHLLHQFHRTMVSMRALKIGKKEANILSQKKSPSPSSPPPLDELAHLQYILAMLETTTAYCSENATVGNVSKNALLGKNLAGKLASAGKLTQSGNRHDELHWKHHWSMWYNEIRQQFQQRTAPLSQNVLKSIGGPFEKRVQKSGDKRRQMCGRDQQRQMVDPISTVDDIAQHDRMFAALFTKVSTLFRMLKTSRARYLMLTF